MTTTKKRVRPNGQMNQSHLIYTFGPGAMLDLPNHSVIVGGLNDWFMGSSLDISEPRLAGKICKLLGLRSIRLRTPPPDEGPESTRKTGITAFQFPERFVTQDIRMDSTRTVRSRMLVHRNQLTSKGYYRGDDNKLYSVVPVRFVRACKAGHIGDIDWYYFVHGEDSECRKKSRQLWMDETGTSGDLTEIDIRCDCKKKRSLAQASIPQNKSLGICFGDRPWLGSHAREDCGQANRLLIRSASNAYFREIMSVISLPDPREELRKAVGLVWDVLSGLEDISHLKVFRTIPKVAAKLKGFSDEDVFEEVQQRLNPTGQQPVSVKKAELEMLVSVQEELGEDKPDGDFFARSLPSSKWYSKLMDSVERVVLVHRLREVAALVGFTRFEPAAPDIEGELEFDVQRAALVEEIKWLPAVENKGEGIFLQFNKEKIEKWLEKPGTKGREQKLRDGFSAWAEEQHSDRKFPGCAYIMLHSFAHLLITAVSLECGYPASSIRERVYALPDLGYGILIYTGTAGSEGTLGGLIQVGRNIQRHVAKALELGHLCSNDPVCAQHSPSNMHERRYLLGAACHGCLLISETCCEQFNDFLDRSLVVPTVDHLQAEFFELGL